MRQPKSRKSKQTLSRATSSRALRTEHLEERCLLAADAMTAWQNPVDSYDVNRDGYVTALDSLVIVNDLNRFGSRVLGEVPAGEPGEVTELMLVDVNGDGSVSPIDVLHVNREIQARGEGEAVSIRLETTDLEGNVITTANVGDEFQLRAYVRDLQGDSTGGVFAAFLDVTYDSALASPVDDEIEHAPLFQNGVSGDISVAGEFDEIGGFSNSLSPLGTDEQLLFTVTLNADSAGDLVFSSNPADNQPANDVLIFNSNNAVLLEEIDFGSTVLEIAGESNVADPMIILPNLDGDSIEIENESPLQFPIDGVDPLGEGLTYTVTVDDPSLVEAEFTIGNRSWAVEVEGHGTMIFEFFEDRAPRVTGRFVELTEAGFFDGLIFHRVIDDFVIQGGDPLGNGTGGSDLGNFDDQFHVDLQHNQVGVLSMAKSTDDTNNSQFFVTDIETPFLDFNHSIFGQFVEGFEVLESISGVAVGFRDLPIDEVVISSATLFEDNENAILSLRALETSGTTNVTVTATDANNRSVSETFTIDLAESSRNSPPFLDDIPDFEADAGSTFEFQLGATDIEGDDLIFEVDVISPFDATATVSDTGLVEVGIPDASNSSEVVLNVSVRQFGTATDEQRVNIAINVDVIGTVAADEFTVDEDVTDNFLDVLLNDDVDLLDAEVISISGADVNGIANIDSDGQTIVYAPAPDFFGTATFTYLVQTSDGIFEGDVTVNVLNVPDGPNAVDDFFPQDLESTDPNISLFTEDSAGDIPLTGLFLNDLNVDGDEQEIMTITGTTDPEFGSITFNAFQIRYTPAPDFFGTDTFTYTTTGAGTGLTSTATVTIEIAERNDPPVVQGEARTANAGELTIFEASDLLANDSPGPENESNQTLRISQVNYAGDGIVTLNDDGNIEYTPAAGFSGVETITYAVEDDGTSSGESVPLAAFGELTVTVESDEPPEPLTVADSFVLSRQSEDVVLLDVLANDDQNAGLELIAVSQPNNSQTQIVDGQIEWDRSGALEGDTFTYTVRSATGFEETTTVTISLIDQGLAVDDSLTIDAEVATLDVLANDSVPDGETEDFISIQSITQPTGGVASIDGRNVQYTPDANTTVDSFTYTIVDEAGFTSTATVDITVDTPENQPPTAFDDDFEVVADQANQLLNVLDNDTTLPDTGETLSITSILVEPQNGSVAISADFLILIYTPDAGFTGTDTLTYEISDGNGGVTSAEVDITVVGEEPVDPDPDPADTFEVLDDPFLLISPGEHIFDVLLNDTPSIGGTLTITSVDLTGADGLAVVSDDGTEIIYTPNFDLPGIDTFTYTVLDSNGQAGTGTVSVSIPNRDDNTGVGNFRYAGQIYNDLDNNGVQDSNETGLGGVTVLLSGTDNTGNEIQLETQTSITGEFAFDGVPAGEFTVEQVQPALFRDGTNIFDFQITQSDERDIIVTEQTIQNEGNLYGERGLFAQFALIDTLSSQRRDGLLIVMEDGELSWVEDRGGWDEVGSIGITQSGDTLTLSSSELGSSQLSMSDPRVQLIGRTRDYTLIRLSGSTDELISAAAADEVFAG